ncbi:Transcriptional regulatory protein, C terminal [Bradyrhizobium erythrophlei]|uniref:Transcriptional regulatory protein, C terminal n=1 Tax=Bradyrhizobium erythrophlei TaxID=1437360 RepID=A0A1M5MKJ9_9BRAD|nr:Transcriptional regulatory protein, C terminal [Bradyrhizobium erythrophlei]
MTLERPMFPPVDPTRRRFLSVAAGGAVATAASTTTQAIGTPDTPDLLRVGSLELDLTNRIARRGDRSLDLLPREFCLLEYMMRRHGQILTRAMLFQEVWHYKFVPETNLVDAHLGKLRRKVDGPNEAPRSAISAEPGSFSLRPRKRCRHEQRRQIPLQRQPPRPLQKAAPIKERHTRGAGGESRDVGNSAGRYRLHFARSSRSVFGGRSQKTPR